MGNITIDAGTLTASREDRTVTGLLVPYNEECRSNLGRFKVGTGAFSVPADLAGMSLNVEHERERVIGAPVSVRETPKGMIATFSIARTPEGDQALEDIASGKRKHLSAEVSDVVIRAGRAVGGRLFAAALTATPAFPSATLLAAAVDTPGDASYESHWEDEWTDEDGVTWRRVSDYSSSTDSVTDEDGTTVSTTTSTSVEELTPIGEQPTDDDTNTDTDTEEDAVGVPNTLTAGKAPASTPAATTQPRPVDLRTLFAAMNRARVRQATQEDMTLLASHSAALGGSPDQIASTLMAALSDIKISGTNSLPVGGAAIQPNWVGQIDQGITYERQYVPLAKTGTNITAEGKKGYKVKRGTASSPVDSYASTGEWSGNKAAIGSGTGFTQPVTSTLHRFAFGDDVAREYYDLPGGEEVLAAYFALIKEDHLVWSDEKALAAWVALAGTPVAPATYPTDYPEALGVLIQGIAAVKKAKADKRRDKPSFAIVNEAAYDELLYTPFENIPEYIKFSFNTDGTGLADGDIRVVVGDIGIEDTPAALVGASYALELDELAGGPLWIDALNIANGGVDRAIHGYLQEFQVRPEAVVLVGTADAA